jgi:hypothetical protein
MSITIGFFLLVAALPFAIIQQIMVGESIRDPRPNMTKTVWFAIATAIALMLAYAGMWIILFRSFG